MFLVVQIICSSIRYMRHPESRVVSLMLMARLGLLCHDTVKLTRIIPFVLCLLEDPVPAVRAMSIRTLKMLLISVTEIQPLEANIFEQCIFPALSKKVIKDPEVLVRVTFAECMGKFAEASKRFLNIIEFSRLSKANETESSSGNNASASSESKDSASSSSSIGAPSSESLLANNFDAKLGRLHEVVSKWVRDLILDAGMVGEKDHAAHALSASVSAAVSSISSRSFVRRAILKNLVRFCSFFGTRERIMDMLLVHILSYVNHQDWESDWELRRDFCIYIPGVCAFLGPTIASEWVLPCIDNVRVDVEEIVVASSIQCVTSLIKMNLLSKSVIFDSFQKTVPLLVHPCNAIRQSCIDMTVAIAQNFGVTDAYVFLLPCLRPILKCDMIGLDISHANLNLSLVSPLSRKAFQKSLRGKVMAVDVLTSKPSEEEEVGVGVSGILVDMNEEKDKDAVLVESHVESKNEEQTPLSTSSTSGGAESPPEESMLLGFLDAYIVAVGQNVNARKAQWMRENNTQKRRSIIMDTKNKKRGRPPSAPDNRLLGSSVSGLANSHVDGHLLDLFSYKILHGLGEVHSVLIPNQKYNLNNHTTEAMRYLANNEDSEYLINDFKMLKKMYGVISKQSDANKQEQQQQTDAASSISSSEAAGGGGSLLDVPSLHRVIQCLDIPPLGPDTG